LAYNAYYRWRRNFEEANKNLKKESRNLMLQILEVMSYFAPSGTKTIQTLGSEDPCSRTALVPL
jgi:hypothetical protein